MKYIINGKEYTSKTANPHGTLREILINAMLNGKTVEIVKE